jgi:hypothetical protein
MQMLRQVLHCTLPVEVAWQGAAEMDNITLAALQQQFAPLSGFDVTAMPYPQHMRMCEQGQEQPGLCWCAEASLSHR